jgi:rubredoxin
MVSTPRPLEEVVSERATSWTSGMRAKGEFRCSECGYGVTVHRHLPVCPMCQGTSWSRVPWRPYTRSLARPVGDGR